MNRQKLILFLLLVLFGGAVIYAYVRSPKPQRVAKLKYAPGAVASAPRPKAGGAKAGAPKAAAPQAAPAAQAAPSAAAIPAAPLPQITPATSAAPGGSAAPSAGGATGGASATPATAAAPTAGAAPRQLPGRGPQIANDETRVHLELLDQARPFSGYRRNIFSPIFREEVKAPPIGTLPPLPPRPSKKALPPPPPPRPLNVQPVQPPPPPPPTAEQLADQELAKFTFLGFLKKNGDRTVFLSKNNEIFLAKKGSKLGPNFIVGDLSDDAITIKSVAEGRELVIPLVENRGLRTHRTK
jgi:hypothetical protein